VLAKFAFETASRLFRRDSQALKGGTDMSNGVPGEEPPSFTTAVFLTGAVGGVALDVLGLYFAGFPENHTLSWYVGRLVIVAGFMALTGFLACVYANGQLRTAFVIGVAAPSILLNIAASVQRPKDLVPVIPSIPATEGRPISSLQESSARLWLFAVSTVEAQPSVSSSATYGQLKIAIAAPPAGVNAIKGGELLIFDAAGRMVGKTLPPSNTFIVALPTGHYTVQYKTPNLQSSPVAVVVDEHHTQEVTMAVHPVKTDSTWGLGWTDFLNGASHHANKLNAVKTQYLGGP
jgi:hypothetical protein